MLKYIISISLIFTATLSFGQKDSVRVKAPKEKGRFIPNGIRIGTDLVSIAKSSLKEDYKEYQLQADIDFYRYFLNVGFGTLEQTLRNESGDYTVEGKYFRVGPDINFLHRDPDKSALFFGVRYSFTTFSDRLNYSYENPFFGDGINTVSNTDLKANWFEMVTGMKVKMWKMVWLGYTARFKFAVDTFENNDLIPTVVPGYGPADEKSAWAINYYLIIRIPVRKEVKAPVLLKTK